MRTVRWSWMCVAALLLSLSLAAMAQNEQGQGGGRRAGRGRMVTLAMVPVSVLNKELKLTDDQASKLTAIHDKFEADAKALAPQEGQQPDPASFQKRRELMQQANKDMEAVLTDDQKAKLPDVMKQLSGIQAVGIPLGVLPDLKLTDDQEKKIFDIALDAQQKMSGLSQDERRAQGQEIRRDAHDKALAVLTDDQKTAVAKYLEAHPMRGYGRGRRNQNSNNQA